MFTHFYNESMISYRLHVELAFYLKADKFSNKNYFAISKERIVLEK